jgi:putative ABC transport system permease protein
MLKNYLKTALRIMFRQKAYSAINVIGLSLGIAATLLIILYVTDEVSFDRFHKDADRIYRVTFFGRLQGNDFNMAVSPAPVAAAMKAEIPEVENVTRFGVWRSMPIAFDDKSFTETMLVADSNFFDFFSFAVVAGDPKTMLIGPQKIVLTESAARRYFGSDNAIGKTLLSGSEKTASVVTGVIQDPPANSHVRFDLLLSGESWKYMRDQSWLSNNLYTYIKVYPGANVAAVRTKLGSMVEMNMGRELEKFLGMTWKQFKEKGDNVGLVLQPLLDIHLRSNLTEEIQPNGDIQYIYIFGAIAVFLLLIACINFMNLSTARSANRAKEVGVRKSIGAVRTRLIGQFLAESMIYSFLSTIVAVAIIGVVITPFNNLAGKQMSAALLLNPVVIGGVILFALLVGLLAGSYPALYLTSFNPSEVLKGKIRAGFRNSGLRNGLVVFQFMISIVLILGSMVVYGQLKFMQQKNMGFDKENVVDLLHTWSLGKNAATFKNELAAHPEFAGSSFASDLPPRMNSSNAFRKGGTEQDFLLNVCWADYDHIAVMKYEMLDGRFFSREFPSDSGAIVVNETAYKLMGFDKIENQEIINYNGDKPQPLRLVGVIKDFNFETLRNNVKPMAFLLSDGVNGEMAIRLAPGNTQASVALLESIWKKHSSATFEYSFLDQGFDALFRAEQRMSNIILIFTVLTISIACLGLFGLATYTAEQRAKEISIRKVMGASIPQVITLLLRDFTLLIVIAFVIAAPLGWYFTREWLYEFAYHIEVDPMAIVLSGVAALLIALVTISSQAIRAARENPVKAMRSE